MADFSGMKKSILDNLGRGGGFAGRDVERFRQKLLQPGITARQTGKSLRDIVPQSLRRFRSVGGGGPSDPLTAFRLTYGPQRFERKVGRIRKESKEDLQNRIFTTLAQRRGVGTVLTTAGGRRQTPFTPVPVLGQTTSLGG